MANVRFGFQRRLRCQYNLDISASLYELEKTHIMTVKSWRRRRGQSLGIGKPGESPRGNIMLEMPLPILYRPAGAYWATASVHTDLR
jgi:hypothetical protein